MEKILCNNPWEGLCFMMKKALLKEKIEIETKNAREDLKFFKKHKIQTCPVLLVLDKGKIVDRIKGVADIMENLKADVQD